MPHPITPAILAELTGIILSELTILIVTISFLHVSKYTPKNGIPALPSTFLQRAKSPLERTYVMTNDEDGHDQSRSNITWQEGKGDWGLSPPLPLVHELLS